jgi:hypothetical protein
MCYRSPHTTQYPAHVDSNAKMVERIEAERKVNCENAKPPIPYKPVQLMTKPAGAAAAAGHADMEAVLGPAGEVGDAVPNDMARLMLIPAMLRHVRLISNRAGPRALRAQHAADTKCYVPP